MVSPPAQAPAESQSRLLAALLDLARGARAQEADAFSEVARHAAGMLAAEAAGVLRLLGDERAVVVGAWREGGVRGMPVNAELDFDRRNSALGRAHSTGLPARADSYEGLRGELPVVMGAFGLRSSVAAPILPGATAWGAIVVSTTREEPLAADAEQRLGALAQLIGRAVAGIDARRALEASRIRLVEDADAARRGLERDLHQGPHQHLLALMLKLRLARSWADDGSDLAGILEQAIDGAVEADASLRDLARGMFPVMLTERGLAAAVQALAVRAGVPVSLVRLPEPPLPAHGRGDGLLRRGRGARGRRRKGTRHRGRGRRRRRGGPARRRGARRRRPRRGAVRRAARRGGARRRRGWHVRARRAGGRRQRRARGDTDRALIRP